MWTSFIFSKKKTITISVNSDNICLENKPPEKNENYLQNIMHFDMNSKNHVTQLYSRYSIKHVVSIGIGLINRGARALFHFSGYLEGLPTTKSRCRAMQANSSEGHFLKSCRERENGGYTIYIYISCFTWTKTATFYNIVWFICVCVCLF